MAEDLQGYEVVVGVCGGVAAYKVCTVVSALVQRGAGVQVAMTKSARKFVGPVTFQALTARPVFTTMWPSHDERGQQHIQLTEAADLMLVAPATANMLGKVARGIADDLLSTMIMSTDCPVMFAPSMNDRMWKNPIVQANVNSLQQGGYLFVGPEEGWLACRTVGVGRLAEPQTIVEAVVHQLRCDPPRMRNAE
ncbi:MAG: flavoprotein [Phycisphaeraceae bacterium]